MRGDIGQSFVLYGYNIPSDSGRPPGVIRLPEGRPARLFISGTALLGYTLGATLAFLVFSIVPRPEAQLLLVRGGKARNQAACYVK